MQRDVYPIILEALVFYKRSLCNRACTLEDFTEILEKLVMLDMMIDEMEDLIESKED